MKRGIRQVKAELDALRDEYDRRRAILEQEIITIRKSSGYKLKQSNFADYFEPGRSREPGQR
jgi:hypothetical protein